jgi:putative transcriptional regulator
MENQIDTYDKYLASRMRKARIENRYSQEDIGKLLNLPKQSISRIENAKRKITPLELMKLTKFFGLSVEELFDENNFVVGNQLKKYADNLPEYAKNFIYDFNQEASLMYGQLDIKKLKRISEDVNKAMNSIIIERSEEERILKRKK